MRTFLLVLGVAAACLAAEIPKNATDASAVSTPALVVPAAAPAPVGAAIGAVVNTTNGTGAQLRPEDLMHAAIAEPSSSDKPTVSVDNLFPDILLHHEGDHPPSAVPAPAYVVNETHHQGGENLMEISTKHTFIMKISSTTGKPGAHPEPHPEPEPTAEPEPSSGSTAGHGHGSSTTKQTTLKPSSLPKTSGAASLSPALVAAAAAVLISRLC